MDCGTCGSQDTKFVKGISKKTGKPWQAYDCQEPTCVNEKGYPSRTFSFTPKGGGGGFTPKTPSKGLETPNKGTLEAKIDQILRILKANFPEQAILETEETPF